MAPISVDRRLLSKRLDRVAASGTSRLAQEFCDRSDAFAILAGAYRLPAVDQPTAVAAAAS